MKGLEKNVVSYLEWCKQTVEIQENINLGINVSTSQDRFQGADVCPRVWSQAPCGQLESDGFDSQGWQQNLFWWLW